MLRPRPKLTEKQFDEWASQIGAWVAESVSPFEGDSSAAQAERISRAKTDKLFFFKTYLPHYFSCEFGDFQRDWCGKADGRDTVFLVGVPREHAKSTFWSFGIPLWNTVFNARKFHVYISDTSDLATEFVMAVRVELEENVRLRHDFGNLRGKPWQNANFVTKNGVRHWARGYGEPVRGRKHGPHRPDYVCADDFESDQTVRNPRITEARKDWLKEAVISSIGPGGLFVYASNLFSPRSAISQLIAEEDEQGRKRYESCVYKAWLDRGIPEERPLWPARWSPERLLEKEQLLDRKSFAKEFMNEVEDADAEFKRANARFYEEYPPLNEMTVAAFCDPSGKSAKKNDFRAVVTVGMHRKTMMFYVLDAWIKHKPLEEMMAQCYRMHGQYGGSVGIEENMFGEFLHEAIKNFAQAAGRYIPWVPIRHSSNKEARIVGTLSHLYERGWLLFKRNHSDQNLLLDQLVLLEDANVNDDGPDALEGAVALLQKRGGGKVEFHRVEPRRSSGAGPGAGRRGTI